MCLLATDLFTNKNRYKETSLVSATFVWFREEQETSLLIALRCLENCAGSETIQQRNTKHRGSPSDILSSHKIRISLKGKEAEKKMHVIARACLKNISAFKQGFCSCLSLGSLRK